MITCSISDEDLSCDSKKCDYNSSYNIAWGGRWLIHNWQFKKISNSNCANIYLSGQGNRESIVKQETEQLFAQPRYILTSTNQTLQFHHWWARGPCSDCSCWPSSLFPTQQQSERTRGKRAAAWHSDALINSVKRKRRDMIWCLRVKWGGGSEAAAQTRSVLGFILLFDESDSLSCDVARLVRVWGG